MSPAPEAEVPVPGEVTRLLRAAAEGDSEARDRVIPIVYEELRRIAGAAFRGERPDLSLQPTDLVHDVLVRLVGQDADWNDRAHFFTTAARAMRRLLVDHVRARSAEKRGAGWTPVPLDAVADAFEERAGDLIRLHESLDALAGVDATKARLVELRFFGGLTMAEAGELLGVSLATAERHWAMARAWLHQEMKRA
jgi:RNA polymerase sigma factor (TIGR02999 family)